MMNNARSPVQTVATEKIREKLQREAREFAKATRSYGLFAAAGFLAGIGLVHLEEIHHFKDMAGWHHYLGLALEHGGLGLVVSSIAVFGYEWRSHAKHAFELSEKLQESIDRVINMEAAKGFDALDYALDTLIGSDDERARNRLRDNIKKIVSSAYELRQLQTEETLQYLNVISWLIDKAATKNAENLVGMAQGTTVEFHYEVPASAAEMAGRILGAQMKVLNRKGSKDSYDSIADISHWSGTEFDYYFERTQHAANRGVKIRRVFNLNLYKKDIKMLKPSELDGIAISEEYNDIAKIIKRHVDFARESHGNYQVRFFLNSHIENVKKILRNRSKNDIAGACFGLFKNADSSTIIRFVADTPTLSKMRLGYIKTDHQDIELFAAIWQVADEENPLDDPANKKTSSSRLKKFIQKFLPS